MQSISPATSFVNSGPEYVCQMCGKPLAQCTCRRHSIHVQHGEDRAILGLSREGCRNADQLAGYDAMASRMDAFHGAAAADEADADLLCTWGAELQRRLEAAERRRAWAIALAGTHQTVVAAGAVFDVAVYNRVEVYA